MIANYKYLHLNNDIPDDINLHYLANEDAITCMNFLEQRMQCFWPEDAPDFMPLPQRQNMLITGIYEDHDRIDFYDDQKDLKTLVERFIHQQNTNVDIVTFCNDKEFFALQTNHFRYEQVDYIHRDIFYTQDFFILLREKDIFLYFNEDQPFAYVSFPNREAAKEWFATPEEMKEIYLKNYKDWRIWDFDSDNAYVEKVTAHFYPEGYLSQT